jgi:glycerol-3-phosphate dehydrogenase
VAPGLHEAELRYLHAAQEWARCADDVLWRRSKLGLHYSAAQRAAVDDWCRRHCRRPVALDTDGDGMELTLERIEQRSGRRSTSTR